MATVKQQPTREDLLITRLPGLDQELSFRQYSGLLTVDADHDGRMFFWLAESQSSPADDPLLVYLNGGPGDSSLNALFWENGPFNLTTAATVSLNPYAWNRRASVLYVDQPLGTGLSYVSEGGSVRTMSQAVQEFCVFLQKFYEVFPEHRQRPLFLSGESFAGHYIPLIARAILNANEAGDGPHTNLEGVAIGDGLYDFSTQFAENISYARGLGLIDAAQADAARTVFEECKEEVSSHKADAVTFGKALYSVTLPTGTPNCNVNKYDVRLHDASGGMEWPQESLAALTRYLKNKDVLLAIHAEKVPHEYQGFNLEVFDDLQPFVFSSSTAALAGLLDQLRVLVYVGQWDLICNHLGQEAILAGLDLKGCPGFAQLPRSVWLVDNIPAGYCQSYEELTYLFVLGASHMVPYSVPGPALDMIDRFMAGRSFDDYLPKPPVAPDPPD